MKFYIETAKNVFKQGTAYRFSFWMEFSGIVLGFLIQYYIWQALLQTGSQTDYGLVSFSDMVGYSVLSSVISVLTVSGTIGYLGQKILSGDIALDLIRPLNLRGLLFARAMGETLFNGLFMMLPIWVLGRIFFGLQFQSPAAGALFFLSCAQALLIYFLLSYCLGLLSFWFTKVYVLHHFLIDCIRLFAGSLIPLWFFPGWLQALSRFLPFQYIYFVPISIFMNKVSPAEGGRLLVWQAVWILLLYVTGNVMFRRGIKKVTVQGG